jgi:hypothetical protein
VDAQSFHLLQERDGASAPGKAGRISSFAIGGRLTDGCGKAIAVLALHDISDESAAGAAVR